MNTKIKHSKLIAARRELGRTQQELAEDAGISVRTLQRLEHGGRCAHVRTLLRLADVLHVSPADLREVQAREPPRSSSAVGGQVLMIASIRSGTGRSTLAFHLAGWLMDLGHHVCLVDFDRDLGVTHHVAWTQILRRPVPTHLLATSPMEVARRLAGLRQVFDRVVIDTSGHEGAELLSLASMADQILLTTDQPRQDLGTAHRARMWRNATFIHDKISIVRTKASRYEAHRRKDVTYLQAAGLRWCQTVLQSRTAYDYALSRGLVVTRDDPEGKAAAEIRRLGNELGLGADRVPLDRPGRAVRDRRHTKEDQMYVRASMRMAQPPAVLAQILAGSRPRR